MVEDGVDGFGVEDKGVVVVGRERERIEEEEDGGGKKKEKKG